MGPQCFILTLELLSGRFVGATLSQLGMSFLFSFCLGPLSVRVVGVTLYLLFLVFGASLLSALGVSPGNTSVSFSGVGTCLISAGILGAPSLSSTSELVSGRVVGATSPLSFTLELISGGIVGGWVDWTLPLPCSAALWGWVGC